jgi:hypothetical protein
MSEKQQIIDLFLENVYGKKADVSASNARHDGKAGHWLEQMMGIKANANNAPDLLGYEMKNDTTSKTTFGDWSANKYIFSKGNQYNLNRSEFLKIFGKANIEKGGRMSWSGEPVPKINAFNNFGQILEVDDMDNIGAYYYFSQDKRDIKAVIVPKEMQTEKLPLAIWNAESLKSKLEKKFNKNGWFKCKTDNNHIYTKIVFGEPICFETWILLVKTGEVFFDSGMYETNKRPYSQWRASNSFWDSLVVDEFPKK